MTQEEAKAIQEKIVADGYNLGWWYGIHCEKCCGVFPKLTIKDGFDPRDCSYKCEVCGKRTDNYQMPWQAQEAWNRHEYLEEQIRLF